MGVECCKKAYGLLLESHEWKIEKVTPKGDTIKSTQKDRIGKVYKLTVSIKSLGFNKLLLTTFFNRVNYTIPQNFY